MKSCLSVIALCIGATMIPEWTMAAPQVPAKNNPQTLQAGPQAAESQRLAEFFQQTYQQDLARSPMTQGYRGLTSNQDRWDDVSEAFLSEQREMYKARLAVAEGFDVDALSGDEAFSLTLYKMNLQRRLANAEFPHHGYIMHQFRAWHTQVPSFLINIHRIKTLEDADNYIKRLQRVAPLFEQVIEQLNIREQKGIFPPKWSYEQMIRASKNVISGAPFEPDATPSTLLQDFSGKLDKLDLNPAQRGALIARAKQAMNDHVKPAYEALITELKQHKAISPPGDGVWRLPQGDKWYQNRLHWFTTTDLSAEEVHQLGLDQVARIHKAMERIKEQVNFDGSLAEFFLFMRDDPRFYYPNTDKGRQRYLDEAKAYIDSMKNALPDYFGLIPGANMVVKRVEAFREKSAGKAFYQSPARDGSRPGIYYANLYDMKAMPTYQMEALAYHEGIPGHHMQRTIAQELTGIPEFQKDLSFTAYTEGWGLYSEELAKDMGFYQDPYSDFGRLAMELWRACRLVVDTGIHAKKWSREQAIDYLVTHTPNPRLDAIKAIERYIAMPGQATAYMIGKLKIMALREKAQRQLQDQFDIRAFHDEILKDGPIPLNLLEQKIDSWIAAQGS